MSKKKNTTFSVAIFAAWIIGSFALMPIYIWVGVATTTTLLFALLLFFRIETQPESTPNKLLQPGQENPAESYGQSPPLSEKKPTREAASPTDDTLVTVSYKSAANHAEEYRIPARPHGGSAVTWIPPGKTIEIAETVIVDGMIYVGDPVYGEQVDSSCIDISKSVAGRGDFTAHDFDYWATYAGILPQSRRAYLNWLADGRRNIEADEGYPFLFFHGIERRVLVDSASSDDAKSEWPLLAQELHCLVEVYGNKSSVFAYHANQLLCWMTASQYPAQLYKHPLPEFINTFELPFHIRLALGQTAADKAPVPPALALAWLKLDPATRLRTPALRCNKEFDALFLARYQEKHGEGMRLPNNKTKLKLVYRPISFSLNRNGDVTLAFGDTPDVSATTASITALQELAEAVTKELESYSRYLGRNPQAANTLDATLLLPPELMPDNIRLAIEALRHQCSASAFTLPFEAFLARFNSQANPTKDSTINIVRLLAVNGIGFEPDVLNGAKPPKPPEQVALFQIGSGKTSPAATDAYQAALLTLQLASGVAAADGHFSHSEHEYLMQQIQMWTHLHPDHKARLSAALQLLVITPIAPATLKKRLQLIDEATRISIAATMVAVAHADGNVSPVELKHLEKVYAALGIDSRMVLEDVHAILGPGPSSSAAQSSVRPNGFSLDPERIAQLQQDSAKASTLLSSIFSEEDNLAAEAETAAPAPVEETTDASPPLLGILGLDEIHSALARLLLTRPEWNRNELLNAAADLDVMLDGALEQINEAAYDSHDMPLTDGDDPISVNLDIIGKIAPSTTLPLSRDLTR